MEVAEEDLTLADRWIISRLANTAEDVTRLLEEYDLGEAAKTLYEFIWDEFCDWYIELAKIRLGQSADSHHRLVAQNVLLQVLFDTLRLLHPFMPFITEEIYQNLPGHNDTIMLDAWPVKGQVWPEALEDMQQLMSVIRNLRNIRAEFNVAPGTPINTIILVRDQGKMALFENNQVYMQRLAQVKKIEVVNNLDTKPAQAVSALTAWTEIYVPLEGIIDIEREIVRLEKELKATEADLQRAESKLGNANFLAKAPQEVIAKENAKAEEARVKREGILQRLEILKQS